MMVVDRIQEAIYNNLESTGTKVYTLKEAEKLLQRVGYESIELSTRLSPGDLLNIKPSKKYQHPIFRFFIPKSKSLSLTFIFI